MEREELGKVVRAAWISWAREQPYAKVSWLLPWETLDESDREADRRIGEAVEEVVCSEYTAAIFDLVEMAGIALSLLNQREGYEVTKQNLNQAIRRGMDLLPSS